MVAVYQGSETSVPRSTNSLIVRTRVWYVSNFWIERGNPAGYQRADVELETNKTHLAQILPDEGLSGPWGTGGKIYANRQDVV